MKKFIPLLILMPIHSFATGLISYDGGVFEHHVSLENASLNNTPGSTYEDGWNLGSDIPSGDWFVMCTTIDTTNIDVVYSSRYVFPGVVSNGWISFDDYWDISSSVYIEGNVKDYFQVPFEVSNKNNATHSKCSTLGKLYPKNALSTGKQGKITFKLKKKIVNGYSFISTNLIEVTGITVPTGTFKSPGTNAPFVRVVLDSFMISLPEKCEINAGQALDIDFGNVSSTKLDGINYEKYSNLNVKCSSGDFASGLSSVYADYIGDTTFSEQYFGSDNDNIAIAVRDDSHKLIKPGDRKKLDLNNGETQIGLSLAPISDSKNLKEGEFNANIIIRLNLE